MWDIDYVKRVAADAILSKNPEIHDLYYNIRDNIIRNAEEGMVKYTTAVIRWPKEELFTLLTLHGFYFRVGNLNFNSQFPEESTCSILVSIIPLPESS